MSKTKDQGSLAFRAYKRGMKVRRMLRKEGVLIPAKYRRQGLKLKDFACVIDGVAKYPLRPKKRALNAMARYMQPQTAKCKGGLKKICKAYKKYRVSTDASREKCHY